MQWTLSRVTSSLMGLLQERSTDKPADLEQIRRAMMETIAAYLDSGTGHRPVWRRLLYATDIQSLWYLRSDLMHLLSEQCGESRAGDLLRDITLLFRGHIPRAQFASARCGV